MSKVYRLQVDFLDLNDEFESVEAVVEQVEDTDFGFITVRRVSQRDIPEWNDSSQLQ